MPFGTSGTYEQEVEIHLHPPRAPEAEARIWELQVAGESKAYQRQAAAAPLHLGIQPFEEFKTKLSPERASGRKKAQYDVAVKNTANAPVTVALDAADQDNELEYAFTPATLEIPPGKSHESKMLVKPPRQKLDRAPGGEAHPGLHQDRRGGRTRPSPPRTWSCPRASRARKARAAAPRPAPPPRARGQGASSAASA